LIAAPSEDQFSRNRVHFKGNILDYNILKGQGMLLPSKEIMSVLMLVVIEIVIFDGYNMEG
jgi:hypothetical protein